MKHFFWPFLISAAFAQPLTLELAQEEGQKNAPLLQQLAAQIDELTWKRWEVLAQGFLPKAQINANHFFLSATRYGLSSIQFFGQATQIPGIFPNNQVTLNASLPLFNGLANLSYVQAAEHGINATKLQKEYLKLVIANQISMAFYQTLAANSLLLVAKQNIQTMKSHLDQVKAQNKEGRSTQLDTLRVQVQLEEAQSDLESAQDEVILSRKKLIQTMGYEQDPFDELKGDLPIPVMHKTDKAIQRADIQAQEEIIQAEHKNWEAKSRWWTPQIGLIGQISYYNLLLWNNQVIDRNQYKISNFVGINLSWNIFDSAIGFSQTRQAFAKKIQEEQKAVSQKIKAQLEVEIYQRKIQTSTKQYFARKLNLERSQESVRLTQAEYAAGTRTITDVLYASSDLFKARAGVITANLDAQMALLQYEVSIGKKIQ
jgi:outer membrane protein TolC